jgi:hypothetical protein
MELKLGLYFAALDEEFYLFLVASYFGLFHESKSYP